jgi:hypothetical protein
VIINIIKKVAFSEASNKRWPPDSLNELRANYSLLAPAISAVLRCPSEHSPLVSPHIATMRAFTTILLLAALFGLARLNTYASSPDLSRAESHVLRTIAYSVGSGLLTNGLCGILAPRLDPEIKAKDAFTSCMPFGLAGTAITIKLYMFATTSWKAEEWQYAKQLPRRAEITVMDVLGMNPEIPRGAGARSEDDMRQEL